MDEQESLRHVSPIIAESFEKIIQRCIALEKRAEKSEAKLEKIYRRDHAE